MKFMVTRYQARHPNEDDWKDVSEGAAMEIISDYFNPVVPALKDLLLGKEVSTTDTIIRKKIAESDAKRQWFRNLVFRDKHVS